MANDEEYDGETQTRISLGDALSEIVGVIKESRSEDNVAPVFKMSDLPKCMVTDWRKLEPIKKVESIIYKALRIIRSDIDITTDSISQETLPIAQMLILKIHKRLKKSQRHAKTRETPSHIYLGIVINCQTTVSEYLTNTFCKQYQEEGYVCPTSLQIGLFTTEAVDNIDHNPSSRTAKDSFHE
ncbi:unnamed protein product [Mytilus coruscus]|uniref:Uncharacterized protein n=1 Tax=Mytilus coruscus TaxID=42192 RepID=A0A6J8A6I3_MYTCO|nr:unnamed protein product [Mytilus coruscus]